LWLADHAAIIQHQRFYCDLFHFFKEIVYLTCPAVPYGPVQCRMQFKPCFD
jgi:hypothetical protein